MKYLLNLEHEQGGRDKAIFFMRFGFTIEAWQVLAQSLLAHAAAHEVTSTSEKPNTINHVIEGVLETPDKREPLVRTVWTIEKGSASPRFVTAYPLKERS